MSTAILGISYHLPDRIETNEDLAREHPDWRMDDLFEKSGIRARHVAGERETASDLGYHAAQKLLERSLVPSDEIDYLIYCTQSPDQFLPPAACVLQPLYVTELVAALARGSRLTITEAGTAELASGSAPSSLSAAIADRLGFVAGPVREVLRAAALLGMDFAVPDLAIVLVRSVADLIPAVDEACAVGVLAESGYGSVPASADPGGPVRRDASPGARRLASRRGTRPGGSGRADGPGGPASYSGRSADLATRRSRWMSGCWTGWAVRRTCWSARRLG